MTLMAESTAIRRSTSARPVAEEKPYAGMPKESLSVRDALARESPTYRVAALRPAFRISSTGMPPVERGDTSSSMWPSRALAMSGIVRTVRPNDSMRSFSSSTSAGVRCAPGRKFTWPGIFSPPSASVPTIASTAAAYPSCREPQ